MCGGGGGGVGLCIKEGEGKEMCRGGGREVGVFVCRAEGGIRVGLGSGDQRGAVGLGK